MISDVCWDHLSATASLFKIEKQDDRVYIQSEYLMWWELGKGKEWRKRELYNCWQGPSSWGMKKKKKPTILIRSLLIFHFKLFAENLWIGLRSCSANNFPFVDLWNLHFKISFFKFPGSSKSSILTISFYIFFFFDKKQFWLKLEKRWHGCNLTVLFRSFLTDSTPGLFQKGLVVVTSGIFWSLNIKL